MIELKELGLTNVGVHANTRVTDLDTQKFVTINGLNLDSPDVADNSNGVGKSMLFGALPTMLFEADPLALSKNNKGNFINKGEIDITWTSPDGKTIQVVQTKNKYKVFLDGEDMKVNIQDVAKNEWIKKYFPVTRDEFYSYCYIQTQIPHPFQRATPGDRLKYLTSVFNLSVYDNLRALFKQRLNEASHAESEAKGLADMLDVNERKMRRLKVDSEVRAKLMEDSERLHQYQDEVSELYAESVVVQTEANKAKQYSHVKKQIKDLAITSSNPKAEIKEIQKALDLFDRYQTYLDDKEEYKEAVSGLVKQIAKLRNEYGDGDSDTLRDKHEALGEKATKIEDKIAVLVEAWEEYEEHQNILVELRETMEDNTSTKLTLEEVEDAIADQRVIINTYRNLSGHSHDDDSCPTCGSKLDLKALAKSAKKAKGKVEVLQSNAEWLRAKALLDKHKAIKVKKPKETTDKLSKQLAKLDKRISAIEVQYAGLRKIEKLERELSSHSKPKKVSKPKGKPEALEDQLELLEKYVSLKATLKAIGEVDGSHDKLKKKAEAIDKKITKKKKVISRLTDSTQELRAAVQEYDHYKATVQEIKAKLRKLKPLIKRREVLEHLFKAYGTNLKLKAIQGILKQLEDSLNKYSHLVFPEGMKFSLSTSAKGINAQVTRMASGQTTDIMSLSGAETNCFRLLYAIAILPFIPEHRRTNFIVLDEPENSCSPAVRQHIIENFLPIIRAVVPNVYWITPLEVESLHATNWTIVKQGGKSTLKVREQ